MLFSELEWAAIWVTVRLAFVSTVLLIILGTPLAWWLATTASRWRAVVNALVAMPLVLPPTVLGFYLLLFMGPQGPLGQLTFELGAGSLAFSFSGLVIGSVIYSLPFVVQPIQNALRAIGPRPMEAAASLGASGLDRFFSIAVPLAKPGFVTAAVLGFAHTVGEFGVVLMIGGNIAGETQVMSTLIYDQVQMLDYPSAGRLSMLLLLFSFAVLLLVYGSGSVGVKDRKGASSRDVF